jgi:hypothetical protein
MLAAEKVAARSAADVVRRMGRNLGHFDPCALATDPVTTSRRLHCRSPSPEKPARPLDADVDITELDAIVEQTACGDAQAACGS